MYCPGCGKENKDGAKFCSGCGRGLTGQELPLKNNGAEPAQRAAYNAEGMESSAAIQGAEKGYPAGEEAERGKRRFPMAMKVLLTAVLCLLVGGGVFLGLLMQPENRLRHQLSLGQKYLSELEYDRAILAFQKAIQIDAENTDAYIMLADAYSGKAFSGNPEEREESAALYAKAIAAYRTAEELGGEAESLLSEAEERYAQRTGNGWTEYQSGWYFFDEKGMLLKTQWIDGLYYVDEKGRRMTGGTAPDGRRLGADGMLLKSRPSLFDGIELLRTDIVPQVPEIALNEDFSNIINLNNSFLEMGEEEKALLRQNLFLVKPSYEDEFFEIYERNRYSYIPNFVTIDSMTHTYHLYFGHLMKNTERNYLLPTLGRMTAGMLEESTAQLEKLRGTEWEEAAKLNVLFFGVADSLLQAGGKIPEELRGEVEEQAGYVQRAEGAAMSLTGNLEDFSQYKPRGYYEGDAQLERYFRTMMWYGRINFTQKEERLNRAALLMTMALRDGREADWESIYTVTSFFAGASDDSGYFEYEPLLTAAYGAKAELSDLIGNERGWKKFKELTKQAEPPKINSMFVDERNTGAAREEEIRGYRFMGQRFSIDATIFQNLIYNRVEEINGEKRDLPSGLDVPAAFGSDTALAILKEAGEDRFPGYTENMEKLRKELSEAPDTLWNASLYSQWLYMLRPALETKGAGYPLFMQSEEWKKKNLQSFLGSYTELKHDTVLYAKQVMAEMGGEDPQQMDDRGYVEPEPELWRRLSKLTEASGKGLARYNMLGEEDSRNLRLMQSLIDQLRVISEKELRDEPRSDAEYELIRTYGGQLEHFWQEVYKNEPRENQGYGLLTKNFPAAVVTDAATGLYGRVLELATGKCNKICVLVPIDGTLRIAQGSVYSYYEFPYNERLTDTQWRTMMGFQTGDDGYYAAGDFMQQPAWTESFTYSGR